MAQFRDYLEPVAKMDECIGFQQRVLDWRLWFGVSLKFSMCYPLPGGATLSGGW